MARKKHRPIPLTGATKVLRAHSTQIDPPGMLELENVFMSRSDNSISLRSDWQAAYEGMFSYSSLIQGDDVEDFLNAAFYVTRAGHAIYIGRWAPYTWDSGAFGQLFEIYDDGTIRTDGLKSEVIGTGTAWLQQIWPGCLIRKKGEGNDLYKIRLVTTDTRLVTSEPMPGIYNEEYEIFRTHPANRAEWPIRMESLGGFLIYGTVDMNQPIDEKYISGPFFSNIGRPNLGVWFGTNPVPEGIVVPMTSISVGFDDKHFGTRYVDVMQYLSPITISGEKGAVFARNWLGNELFAYPSGDIYPVEENRESYLVSTGMADNITHSSCETSAIELLTIAGGSVQVSPDGSEINDSGISQYSYDAESPITKSQPFGDRTLNGQFGTNNDRVVGDSGFFGSKGYPPTTYTTGVSASLRDGVSYLLDFDFTGDTYNVIVGDADSLYATVLYFTDPLSITRAVMTGVTESLLAVTYSSINARVIAVGTNGTCLTSDDDGVTWDARTVGMTTNINSIASDVEGRCLCLVGAADEEVAQAYLSMDGITWEFVDSGIGTADLVDVKFNKTDGCFYTVSAEGQVYRIRKRVRILAGSTVLGTIGEASDYVADVQWDGNTNQFVAVGSKIWTSPTGATWTERHTPEYALLSVAVDELNADYMVAVGLAGGIYQSTNNGVTWSQETSPVGEFDLVGVIYNTAAASAGDFIAIGNQGKVIRSPDGESWHTMTFPTTANLLAISTSRLNTGNSQYSLAISAADGEIYVCKGGVLDSYEPWRLWAPRPVSVYEDDESNKSASGRKLRLFAKNSYHSIGAITTFPFNLTGAVELILADRNWTLSVQDLDDFRESPVFQSQLNCTEYLNSGGTWSVTSAGAFGNSLAIPTDPDNLYPVIMRRVNQQATTFVAVGSGAPTTFDGFVTSTDLGLTWSTQKFPHSGYYTQPQAGSIWQFKPVFLAGRKWAPICTDGTDFLAVISSNQYSLVPQAVVMAGFEIDFEAEEVE